MRRARSQGSLFIKGFSRSTSARSFEDKIGDRVGLAMMPCLGVWVIAVAGGGGIDLFDDSSWNSAPSWSGWRLKGYLTCSLTQATLRYDFYLVRDSIFFPLIVG